MSENIVQIKIDGAPAETSDESLLSRKTLHQNIFGKLRPVPFQYHWTVWFDKHDKASSASPTSSSSSSSTSSTPSTTSSGSSSSDTSVQSQQYTSRLTVLYEDVSDIAIFYRIYNNFPWDRIRLRDTVHIFRQGVKPVWEDPENCNGGCWTFRVPKAKGQEFFHEVAILTMGNELQAAVEGEHDHVLGVSISIRFNTYLISIWNKLGSNKTSIDILEHTILDRLSPELRPTNVVASSSYFYKRHADHDGFTEAVEKPSSSSHQS